MDWRFATASAVGTSHMRTGLPCQDSIGANLLYTSAGVILVTVVADGAGSAAYAEIGSKAVVDHSLRLVNGFFEEGGTLDQINRETALCWLDELRDLIGQLADTEPQASLNDFASTWLLALIGDQSAVFVQIGDGAMVAQDEAEGWSYIFWPQHGEYANTTNFVTSSYAVDSLEFSNEPRRIDRFASFSDGIENLVLHQATRTVHAPFFAKMFQPVDNLTGSGFDGRLSASLSQYLGSEAICDRTDDDKSLILATRAPSPETGSPTNHDS